MIYLYARVSTQSQKLDRQIKALTEKYPLSDEVVLITEKYTGTTTIRPEFQKLQGKLKPNDKLVVEGVSRFSRNANEAFTLYEDLVFNKGVALEFLKEPHINSDVYKLALSQEIQKVGNEVADTYIEATNKVLRILANQQIQIAFDQAQAEVQRLHQRIREGMAVSPNKPGRTKGKIYKSKNEDKIKEIMKEKSKSFGKGALKDSEVIAFINGSNQDLHISRNTYYKYKREITELRRE